MHQDARASRPTQPLQRRRPLLPLLHDSKSHAPTATDAYVRGRVPRGDTTHGSAEPPSVKRQKVDGANQGQEADEGMKVGEVIERKWGEQEDDDEEDAMLIL